MSEEFQWLETKTVYREVRNEELRWLVNRETILNTATGKTTTRSHLRQPGICVIAAFPDAEHILLMRQYRYAADKELWELSAGTLEGKEEDGRMAPTETPEACAARELLEETGYEAGEWEKVAECYTMPGSSDDLMHLFFARRLTKREQSLGEGEIIREIRPFSLAEIDGMIERGEIRDAKTLIGLFYALRRAR